jgi:hypothetical protein
MTAWIPPPSFFALQLPPRLHERRLRGLLSPCVNGRGNSNYELKKGKALAEFWEESPRPKEKDAKTTMAHSQYRRQAFIQVSARQALHPNP